LRRERLSQALVARVTVPPSLKLERAVQSVVIGIDAAAVWLGKARAVAAGGVVGVALAVVAEVVLHFMQRNLRAIYSF